MLNVSERREKGKTISCRPGIFGVDVPFVAFYVKIQIGRGDESLFANEAPVGFFSGVDPNVNFEIGRRQKGFGTKFAMVTFQSLVIVPMDVQIGGIYESFAAVVAFEGPLTRVGPHVSGKVRRSQKTFVAFRALERFVAFVAPQVDFVIGGIDEILVADVAAVAAPFRVHFQMEGKIGAVGKGFVAVFAGVTFRRSGTLAPVEFKSVLRGAIGIAELALVRGFVSFRTLGPGATFFFVLSETPVIFESLVALGAPDVFPEEGSAVVFRVQGRGSIGRRASRNDFFFHRRLGRIKLIDVGSDFHILYVIETRPGFVFVNVHFHWILPVGGAILWILQRVGQEHWVGHGTSPDHSRLGSCTSP